MLPEIARLYSCHNSSLGMRQNCDGFFTLQTGKDLRIDYCHHIIIDTSPG